MAIVADQQTQGDLAFNALRARDGYSRQLTGCIGGQINGVDHDNRFVVAQKLSVLNRECIF